MAKKIFISGINTELGYHLTQTLRRDHIYLQNYPLITGSTVLEQKGFMLHESVHQTFNFKEQRDVMMRSIIGADVVIVDLRYHVEKEVEIILKVLRHSQINHKIRVIGVSNHATWCNGQSVQFKTSQQSSSRQTLLEHSLNKSHWRQHQLDPRWYKLRNPHPSFVYNYNLEEQLLSLPQFQPLIQSMILCTGVMFGKSGMDLSDEIRRAVNFKQSAFETVPKKQLPITSVETLLNKIQDIVYGANPKFQDYMVLCEDQTVSISELLEMINEQCGNLKSVPEQSKGVSEQLPRSMEGNRPSNMLEVPEGRGNSNSSKLGSGHQLMNEPSGRSTSQQPLLLPLSNVNSSRGSSQNFTSIEQQIFSAQTPKIIPEIRYAKNKRMMLLGGGMGVKFKKEGQQIKENDDKKDIPKEQSHEKHLALSDGNQQQAAKSGLRSIVPQMIDDYLQYWEQGYFRFIIPEETIQFLNHDHNTNDDNAAVINKMLRCCPILNTISLNATIQQLITTGTISHERLITPEDHKKNRKDNSRESVAKKQLYETFLKEGLLGWLGQNVNKSFGVCLKTQLLEKVLLLVKEDQELHAITRQVQFLFLGIKNDENHQNQNQMSKIQNDPQVSRSVDLFSAQFCQLFSIALDKKTSSPQKEGITEQSVRILGNTKQLGQGSSLEQGQTKINLISQYLLDNVVVYLAQAKQRLNRTTAGQQIEPQKHLNILLQELKLIRSRQVASMEDQQQTQN